MFVSDLMKTEIISVLPENTLADAARLMLARHIGGLPVLEAGRLVGIVTEGDLLRRVELGTAENPHNWLKTFFAPASLAKEYVHTHGRFVRDVMTADPISVTPETPLGEVADLMCTKHFKRLPVLSQHRLVGVISRTDILAILARRLLDTGEPCTETQIKDHIMTTLATEKWAPNSGIRVNVTGNCVHLEGAVFNAEEQHAIRVIAETTPGVKDVQDDLVFIDPTSGLSFPAGAD